VFGNNNFSLGNSAPSTDRLCADFIRDSQENPARPGTIAFLEKPENVAQLDNRKDYDRLACLHSGYFLTCVEFVLRQTYGVSPQDGVDSFDLLAGLAYDKLSREYREKDTDKASDYFSKAINKGCYFTYVDQANSNRSEIAFADVPLKEGRIVQMKQLLALMVDKHGLLGCLAASMTYFLLTQYYSRITGAADRMSEAYRASYEYLCLAQKLLNADDPNTKKMIDSYGDGETGIAFFLPENTSSITQVINLQYSLACGLFSASSRANRTSPSCGGEARPFSGCSGSV
jgi:hypothetical protein